MTTLLPIQRPVKGLTRLISCIVIEHVFLLLIVLTAMSTSLRFDRQPWGMFFTYPPRVILLAACCIGLAWFLFRKRYIRAAIVGLSAIGFAAELCDIHPAAMHAVPTQNTSGAPIMSLNFLAMNVHDAVHRADELNDLCRRRDVQVLLLQEVKRKNRQTFLDALPDYNFRFADETCEFEYSHQDAFSLMTGIRRDVACDISFDRIECGITGYRTFATQIGFRVDDDVVPVWLVNVHTTKSFYKARGLPGLFQKAAWKARRHQAEAAHLRNWLMSHDGFIVAAGDFNAPANANNLRLGSLRPARTGFRPHLTFPARLPVWGIDHVLVSPGIAAQDDEVIRTKLSDHCAQFVRLSFHAVDARP